MDRPTEDLIELPVSKMKVRLFSYYTRGERKEIEDIMSKGIQFEQVDEGTPKLKTVDTSYRTKMEDKATLFAIKEYITTEGVVGVPDMDWLDLLPDEDFEFIQAKIPKSKKKLTTKPSKTTSPTGEVSKESPKSTGSSG